MRLESNNLDVEDDSISLNIGWNLIGPKYEIMIENIKDNENILYDKNFYELSQTEGYVTVTKLYPKKAYWVKAKKEGNIIFNYAATNIEDDWGKINENSNMNIALFIAEPEINTFTHKSLLTTIANGLKFNINIANINDQSVNKSNIYEKFLKYYDEGIRCFLSYGYSSILGILNEKFIILEEEQSQRINLDDIIFLEIGSTAVNLLSSNGEIMPRSRYINRIVMNDGLSIQTLSNKFLKEYQEYEELVCLYVDDAYGTPYHNSFQELSKNIISYSSFPVNNNEDIEKALLYINNSSKKLYIVNVIFYNYIEIFLSKINYNSSIKKKLVFAETVGFSDGIIKDPVKRNNFINFNSEFYQIAGSNPSTEFIQKNLSSLLNGNTYTYLAIDSLNIMYKSLNFDSNFNKLHYKFEYISDNYFGLSGKCKFNRDNYDRDTNLYKTCMIGMKLNANPENVYPFPYIITEIHEEGNKTTKVQNNDNNDNLNDNYSYTFSNFFIRNLKINKNYLINTNIGNVFGLGDMKYSIIDIGLERKRIANNKNVDSIESSHQTFSEVLELEEFKLTNFNLGAMYTLITKNNKSLKDLKDKYEVSVNLIKDFNSYIVEQGLDATEIITIDNMLNAGYNISEISKIFESDDVINTLKNLDRNNLSLEIDFYKKNPTADIKPDGNIEITNIKIVTENGNQNVDLNDSRLQISWHFQKRDNTLYELSNEDDLDEVVIYNNNTKIENLGRSNYLLKVSFLGVSIEKPILLNSNNAVSGSTDPNSLNFNQNATINSEEEINKSNISFKFDKINGLTASITQKETEYSIIINKIAELEEITIESLQTIEELPKNHVLRYLRFIESKILTQNSSFSDNYRKRNAINAIRNLLKKSTRISTYKSIDLAKQNAENIRKEAEKTIIGNEYILVDKDSWKYPDDLYKNKFEDVITKSFNLNMNFKLENHVNVLSRISKNNNSRFIRFIRFLPFRSSVRPPNPPPKRHREILHIKQKQSNLTILQIYASSYRKVMDLRTELICRYRNGNKYKICRTDIAKNTIFNLDILVKNYKKNITSSNSYNDTIYRVILKDNKGKTYLDRQFEDLSTNRYSGPAVFKFGASNNKTKTIKVNDVVWTNHGFAGKIEKSLFEKGGNVKSLPVELKNIAINDDGSEKSEEDMIQSFKSKVSNLNQGDKKESVKWLIKQYVFKKLYAVQENIDLGTQIACQLKDINDNPLTNYWCSVGIFSSDILNSIIFLSEIAVDNIINHIEEYLLFPKAFEHLGIPMPDELTKPYAEASSLIGNFAIVLHNSNNLVEYGQEQISDLILSNKLGSIGDKYSALGMMAANNLVNENLFRDIIFNKDLFSLGNQVNNQIGQSLKLYNNSINKLENIFNDMNSITTSLNDVKEKAINGAQDLADDVVEIAEVAGDAIVGAGNAVANAATNVGNAVENTFKKVKFWRKQEQELQLMQETQMTAAEIAAAGNMQLQFAELGAGQFIMEVADVMTDANGIIQTQMEEAYTFQLFENMELVNANVSGVGAKMLETQANNAELLENAENSQILLIYEMEERQEALNAAEEMLVANTVAMEMAIQAGTAAITQINTTANTSFDNNFENGEMQLINWFETASNTQILEQSSTMLKTAMTELTISNIVTFSASQAKMQTAMTTASETEVESAITDYMTNAIVENNTSAEALATELVSVGGIDVDMAMGKIEEGINVVKNINFNEVNEFIEEVDSEIKKLNSDSFILVDAVIEKGTEAYEAAKLEGENLVEVGISEVIEKLNQLNEESSIEMAIEIINSFSQEVTNKTALSIELSVSNVAEIIEQVAIENLTTLSDTMIISDIKQAIENEKNSLINENSAIAESQINEINQTIENATNGIVEMNLLKEATVSALDLISQQSKLISQQQAFNTYDKLARATRRSVQNANAKLIAMSQAAKAAKNSSNVNEAIENSEAQIIRDFSLKLIETAKKNTAEVNAQYMLEVTEKLLKEAEEKAKAVVNSSQEIRDEALEELNRIKMEYEEALENLNNIKNQTYDLNDFSGSISLNLTGGSENLNYYWSDGARSKNRKNLAPGVYNLTVVDDSANMSEYSFQVKNQFYPIYSSIYHFQINNLLSCSDNWVYYNPKKDRDVSFALITRSFMPDDKLVVLKINHNTNQVEVCRSVTDNSNVFWNQVTNSSKWYDVKVCYSDKGDYAYVCVEGSANKSYIDKYDRFINRVVHIYDLSNLHSNSTYKCVNTIPGISYHNLQVYQDENVSYLYGVGGKRNALEIYDISNDPSKPFFLGGYLAYPDGYDHIHVGGNAPKKSTLYIHDIQVASGIPSLEDPDGEKILGFAACIYESSIVVLDLTDPINITTIVTIVDPRFQNDTFNEIGLHHCWLTPNKEFLITGCEKDTKSTFVIDIASIFNEENYYYNNLVTNNTNDPNYDEELDPSLPTRFVGAFDLLKDSQGLNIHNQYCYKILGDNSNFYLLTAAYLSGTIVNKINYEKLRQLLEERVGIENNLEPAILNTVVLHEKYETYNPDDIEDSNEDLYKYRGQKKHIPNESLFGGVWSASFCPNSNIIFDSSSLKPQYLQYGSPVGFRVFKADVLEKIDGDRDMPGFYNFDNEKDTKLIMSKDPDYVMHPGAYRALIRNPKENYSYEIRVTENDSEEIFDDLSLSTLKGIAYDNGELDLGKFKNESQDTKKYTVLVFEFSQSGNQTNWFDYAEVFVESQMNMGMNMKMAEVMHPPTNLYLLIGETISYSKEVIRFRSSEGIRGYKINLIMDESSVAKFSFENVSLYQDPLYEGRIKGKYSLHAHYYVWEKQYNTDSEGNIQEEYVWVKKGRLFSRNWIPESVIENKYVKITLTNNQHGDILVNNNSLDNYFKLGAPPEDEPEGFIEETFEINENKIFYDQIECNTLIVNNIAKVNELKEQPIDNQVIEDSVPTNDNEEDDDVGNPDSKDDDVGNLDSNLRKSKKMSTLIIKKN